jgi:catalase
MRCGAADVQAPARRLSGYSTDNECQPIVTKVAPFLTRLRTRLFSLGSALFILKGERFMVNQYSAPILVACLALPAWALAEIPSPNYPTADAGLGEKIGETETEDVTALIESISEKIRTQYSPGSARRDQHPKAHGCVSATFTVNNDIPDNLRAGLFQPGAQYESVIRFSNGIPNPDSDDRNYDSRGMAMRLRGVSGDKLVPDPTAPDAQDFVLISSPAFIMNDSHPYVEFFEAVNQGGAAWLRVPFILGWQGSVNAAHLFFRTISHPIYTQYFSITPYQLGEGDKRQAVKYSARACDQTPRPMPANNADKNFLRTTMQESLSKDSACMEFMIQSNKGTNLSVEDVITEWDQKTAPFVPVAKIDIHQQKFDTAEQNLACENMSFNPWHALPAHKPLGGINRLRQAVYQAISKLRHEMNMPH